MQKKDNEGTAQQPRNRDSEQETEISNLMKKDTLDYVKPR